LKKSAVLRYLWDWGVALGLTVLGFWLISEWRAPDLPDNAPNWTMQNLEGEQVSLSDFKGSTVVLNFWAHWCGPCQMEIPAFSSFAKTHPDIVVLGISVDGSAQEVRGHAKRLSIDYPVLIATHEVQRNYKVSTLPTTIIVGPDGKIDDVHVGMMLEAQLEWAIQ
jgi:thiol-disulfide isomerase/thioredoxin